MTNIQRTILFRNLPSNFIRLAGIEINRRIKLSAKFFVTWALLKRRMFYNLLYINQL